MGQASVLGIEGKASQGRCAQIMCLYVFKQSSQLGYLDNSLLVNADATPTMLISHVHCINNTPTSTPGGLNGCR